MSKLGCVGVLSGCLDLCVCDRLRNERGERQRFWWPRWRRRWRWRGGFRAGGGHFGGGGFRGMGGGGHAQRNGRWRSPAVNRSFAVRSSSMGRSFSSFRSTRQFHTPKFVRSYTDEFKPCVDPKWQCPVRFKFAREPKHQPAVRAEQQQSCYRLSERRRRASLVRNPHSLHLHLATETPGCCEQASFNGNLAAGIGEWNGRQLARQRWMVVAEQPANFRNRLVWTGIPAVASGISLTIVLALRIRCLLAVCF